MRFIKRPLRVSCVVGVTRQRSLICPFREAVSVVQFNLRAFFSVRTWPWMMLFYKLRPMLRSAQVEKELASVREDFSKLKEAFDKSDHLLISSSHSHIQIQMWSLSFQSVVFFSVRSEVKRREAEERQVVLVQEKNDLALQLQAVSHSGFRRKLKADEVASDLEAARIQLH